MKDLRELELIELNDNQLKTVDGGLLLFSKEFLEAMNWAYTEFKKGIDDGYNNK